MSRVRRWVLGLPLLANMMACHGAPAIPIQCGVGYSAGFGHTLWNLNARQDTLEYSRLEEMAPGADTTRHWNVAIWRRATEKGSDSQLCSMVDSLGALKFHPPVVDGAVWIFSKSDPQKGATTVSSFVVGNAPQNRAGLRPISDRANKEADIMKLRGTMIFGLAWQWSGQQGEFVSMSVRRAGKLSPEPTIKAEIRWNDKVRDSGAAVRPKLDSLKSLPQETAQCLVGLGSSNGAEHSSACEVPLPSGWRTVQIVLRGTLSLLSGPQPFQAASAVLDKE